MAAVVENTETRAQSEESNGVDAKREKIFYRRLNDFFDAHGYLV